MTKLTQQQRREKKKQCKQTHNNSDNPESYKDLVFANIKLVYPNVNIINMTATTYSSKKLSEFTKDDNNIIMVFNINNQTEIKSVYSNYMIWKRVPIVFWEKDIGDIAFMIVRGSSVILYPTSKIGNSDILIEELKSILKPRVKECLICFHKFVFEERRVSCCHCQMPLCGDCFSHYIKENPGWCPYCTRHLMFHGVGKGDFENENCGDVFEEFIGEQMRASIKQTNVVQRLPCTYLAEKWMFFMMNR